MIAIGLRHGLRGLRVPIEPGAVLAEVEPSTRRSLQYVTARWAALLGRRARRAGLRVPDAVFGLAWSGAMTQARLCDLLGRLSDGCTEIYMHPATTGGFAGHAPGYRYADELAAPWLNRSGGGAPARRHARRLLVSKGVTIDMIGLSAQVAGLPEPGNRIGKALLIRSRV
jgi:hypothetical protein